MNECLESSSQTQNPYCNAIPVCVYVSFPDRWAGGSVLVEHLNFA